MELIAFDEEGNCLGGSLMDYLIPTALEVPDWETDYTVTPSPHHPIGAKGVGESATVGSPPAIVNAICDALAPYGVRHVDMPCTPSRVWDAMHGQGGSAAMIRGELASRAQQLDGRARSPFVRGDRRARAASRRACAPATAPLVLADGTIEGFVGGMCADVVGPSARAARARDRGAAAAAAGPGRPATRSTRPMRSTARSSSSATRA